MPDVLSNDDLETLAAEYVLGTLDAEERKGATGLLEVDHAFRGTVRVWERRLGELHLMVEPVGPDGKIWERIRSKLDGVVETPPAEAPAEALVGLEASPAETALAETAPADEATEAKPPETAESGEEAKPVSPAADVGWPESKPALVPDEPPRSADTVPRELAPPTLTRDETAVAEASAAGRPADGRGWKIITMMMTVVALVLVALIGAWRFFPERLPAQLRATTVLKMPEPPPPPLPRRPPPPPFDE